MTTMKLYRRTLFVLIGGIGGRTGTQAEIALRTALCGPDGTALAERDFARGMAPYELPRCLQFVYFDFDQGDLENVRRTTRELPDAVTDATRQVVPLAPKAESFSDAAEMLRINDMETVKLWLPNAEGQPQKSPLSSGAGQMPTIGRTALYELFRATGGIQAVTGPLSTAFARLATAGGDLNALSGDSAHSGVDIFVVFSGAGGTGAGTCWDVLRLIAHVHEEHNGDENDLAIYPLVVMPSAFKTEKTPKNRRFHELNAGPVLCDIFQLVDWTHTDPSAIPRTVYPGDTNPIVTAVVPVKTVILFSRPQTLDTEDLQRSIVSFMLSIIGTTVSTERGDEFVPHTARLINNAVQGDMAPDGIGRRPASTALAAELRIPVEAIGEIVAQHLLAGATRELANPAPGEERGLIPLFDRFGAASGLDALIHPVVDERLPSIEGRGAAEITAQLQRRAARAVEARDMLRTRLRATLARLAQEADYGAGIEALLSDHDLFLVARVLLGHPRYADDVTRAGVRGAVARIGQEAPPNPLNFTDTPPALPGLQDRYHGIQRLTVNDPAVREAIRLLDEWLRWAAQEVCHEVWKSYQDGWEPRMRAMEERIRGLVQVYESQAAAEPDDFLRRCGRMYGERTGVVDLLPDGGLSNNLEQWYRGAVLPRLCEELGLAEGAGEALILRTVMHGRWRYAYESTSLEAKPTAALELTLDVVRRFLKDHILTAGGTTETPLLPTIETLLREAAYDNPGRQANVAEDLVNGLRRALQNLLPTDFRPDGTEDGVSGELTIDIFYPAVQADVAIERYLESTALTTIHHQHHEFHPLAGVDFISVVLRRDSLPATAIGEYRRLMRVRAHAIDQPASGDYLPWRQRLGHDPIWLLLRPEERVSVLTSFLAALWDGSVTVADGTDEDPARILVYQVDRTAGSPMDFDLRPSAGGVSRWVDLLCAYERYVLAADRQDRARSYALIARIEPAAPTPAPLYLKLLAIADREAEKAKHMHAQMQRERIESGTAGLIPPPLELQFWQILHEADERNRRRSARWRIEPPTVSATNGGDPLALIR